MKSSDHYLSWQNEDGLEYELEFNGSQVSFGKQAHPREIEFNCDKITSKKIFLEVKNQITSLNNVKNILTNYKNLLDSPY